MQLTITKKIKKSFEKKHVNLYEERKDKRQKKARERYQYFLNFLFYGLVLDILESSKNVENFCWDENVFVKKYFFDFFFLIVLESSN